MLFLVLICLITRSGHPVSSYCPVELSPTTAVVRFGDGFTANCISLSNQTDGMGWESTIGGTPLTHGITSVPLKMDSVTYWTINPQCFLNTNDGEQCSESLPITVYKLPDSVSVHEEDPKGPLESGQTYRFQCDILNVAPVTNLSVSWYQGNKLLNILTSPVSPDVVPKNVSYFHSMKASYDDNGTDIRCDAKLDIPKARVNTVQSKPHKLIVLYPPFFMDSANETLEIAAGSKMTLNCTAMGNPSPSYSWHFPDSIQQTNGNQNENQPFLTPSFELPGTYKCTASNTQGNTSKYFSVIKAKGNRTTFAALVGGFVSLGALLFVGGLFFMTPEGSFAFSKGSYIKGQPTSSGPV